MRSLLQHLFIAACYLSCDILSGSVNAKNEELMLKVKGEEKDCPYLNDDIETNKVVKCKCRKKHLVRSKTKDCPYFENDDNVDSDEIEPPSSASEENIELIGEGGETQLLHVEGEKIKSNKHDGKENTNVDKNDEINQSKSIFDLSSEVDSEPSFNDKIKRKFDDYSNKLKINWNKIFSTSKTEKRRSKREVDFEKFSLNKLPIDFTKLSPDLLKDAQDTVNEIIKDKKAFRKLRKNLPLMQDIVNDHIDKLKKEDPSPNNILSDTVKQMKAATNPGNDIEAIRNKQMMSPNSFRKKPFKSRNRKGRRRRS